MASRWRKLLRGIALVAFSVGVCGALVRGFWGVSQECQAWAASQRAISSCRTTGGPRTRAV